MKIQTQRAAMKPSTPKTELPPSTQLRKAVFGRALMTTITRLCLGSAVVLALSSASTFALLPSMFDTGTEGWTAVDRDELTGAFIGAHPLAWQPAGGNLGGYIQASDIFATYYWRAPAADLPAFSTAYNGTLEFDVISDILTPSIDIPVGVILSEGSLEISHPFPSPTVPNAWTHRSVSLNEAGWTYLAGGGSVGAAAMNDVLMHLSNLDILAEYVSGADTAGLDNVTLQVPEPTSLILALAGTVCGAMLLRRRDRKSA